MRTFWIIMGLAVLATAVLVVQRGRERSGPDLGVAPGAEGRAGEVGTGGVGMSAGGMGGGRSAAAGVEGERVAASEAGKRAEPDALDEMTAALEASLFADPMTAGGFDSAALPDPNVPARSAGAGDGGAGTVSGGSSLRADLDRPPAEATIVQRDDGSVLVDDRFVLKGAGTESDPVQITWEFLVSAQETYQPRLGRKHLPDRLKLVNNKWVSISGYIAFPIMASSADEMLMMLNQWDGCCIGVPPTPYDAIEVKLGTPATSRQKLAVDGSIKGILRVDPYLVRDWLVSLYLMDDARLLSDSASENRAVREPTAGEHAPGSVPGDAQNGGKSGSGSEFWESDTP